MVTIGNVSGTVMAIETDGSTRTLNKGDSLQPGETLQTANDSAVVLIMTNGDVITVPAETSFVLPAAGIPVTPDFFQSASAIIQPQGVDKTSESESKSESVLSGSEVLEFPDIASSEVLKDPQAGEVSDGSFTSGLQKLGSTPALARDNSVSGASLDSPLVSESIPSAISPINTGSTSFSSSAGNTTSPVSDNSSFAGTSSIVSPVSLSGTIIAPAYEQPSTATIAAPTVALTTAGASILGVQLQTVTSSTEPDSTPTDPTPTDPTSTDPTPTDPDPTPATEPPAVGTVVFGETLTQQVGELSSDTDTGTVTSVGATAVTGTDATTILGDYGTLTIQADGTYSYDAADIDLHSDLVAFWTFNVPTSSTSIHDDSNMDSITDTGTLLGDAAVVSGGVTGNALRLDGSGDAMSVQDSVEVNIPIDGTVEARTVSLSFQPASSSSMSGRQVLYDEGDATSGFIIYIQDNALYAGAYDGTSWAGQFFQTSLSGIDASQWHNVTLSLDGAAGTLEAWFDGDSFGETTTAQGISSHSGNTHLGGSDGSGVFHDGAQIGDFGFEGMIDDVRVYNRAVSDFEVNALSANGSATDTFDYIITDSTGGTASSTLSIAVESPANIAPVAVDDQFSVVSGRVAALSGAGGGVLENDGDPEGSTLTVTQLGSTAVPDSAPATLSGTYGTLLMSADGTYAYTQSSSSTASGTDTFSYTVSDGTTTSTASLTVTVIPNTFTEQDTNWINESALSGSDVYAIIGGVSGDSSSTLTVVNSENGTSHRLGNITGMAGSASSHSIGLSPTGVLYGVDGTNLVTINPVTQAATVIGAHGVTGAGITGLAISPDGTIYASGYNGHIYEIDANSGAATDLGAVTGFANNSGDLTWHDGGLYTVANNSNSYQVVRIDPSDTGLTVTPAPNGFDGGALHSLMSVDGALIGTSGYSQPRFVTIDSDTGLVDAWGASVDAYEIRDGASVSETVGGNVLANDADATAVTTIELQDGTSQIVSSSGAVLQGQFGTIMVQADGTYVYTIDNTLDATNNLTSGEVGTEQFIYTATNSSNITSQSTISIHVNGTSEVQTAEQALFTDYSAVDYVDPSSGTMPLAFTVTPQNDTDRITEIRITGTFGSSFNIPSVLTDNGTITGNDLYGDEFVWTANAGPNAGFTSFDAAAAGLTFSTVYNGTNYGQRLTVGATVSEYGSDGEETGSWTTSSAVSTRVVGIEKTQAGTDASDTLVGGGDNDLIIGGAGDDTMSSGDGTDFFIWRGEDIGIGSSPAVDTITDFAVSTRRDVLDLRDLLPDNAAGTLDEYLSFSFNDGDTTIGVSTTAGGEVVQQIVLQDVDLAVNYGTTDATTLINNLTDDGNLLA